MWVMVLGSKGEAADAIRCAQAAAEAECGCKLRVLRTDNGDEFTAAEFASYCADEGIRRHYSGSVHQLRGGLEGLPHPRPEDTACAHGARRVRRRARMGVG